jgi:ribosomal protein S18 acetylase RimI-like enzyme
MFIRPAQSTEIDAAHISGLQIISTREGYKCFASAEYLEGLDTEITPKKWLEWLNDNTKALIAFSDDAQQTPIGFIAFGPIRTRLKEDRGIMPSWPGEIYALYVTPEYWGKGAARSLMVEAVPIMRKNYWDKALLWVIDKNHRAIKFYENLKGQRVGKQKVNIGGKETTEIAIGWKDITRI